MVNNEKIWTKIKKNISSYGTKFYYRCNRVKARANINSTCTCPVYLKEYILKHIVALAIGKLGIRPPNKAICIHFEKKGPGRPKTITKALVIEFLDKDDNSGEEDEDKEVFFQIELNFMRWYEEIKSVEKSFELNSGMERLIISSAASSNVDSNKISCSFCGGLYVRQNSVIVYSVWT